MSWEKDVFTVIKTSKASMYRKVIFILLILQVKIEDRKAL